MGKIPLQGRGKDTDTCSCDCLVRCLCCGESADRDVTIERHSDVLTISPEREIHFDLYIPSTAAARTPVVAFCPGLKGSKDKGPWPYLGKRIAAETGFVFASFNFSLSGMGRDTHTVIYPERFERGSFGSDLDDLNLFLKKILGEGYGFPSGIEPGPVGLLGHSKGGIISILSASENNGAIRAVATVGAPAFTNRFPTEMRIAWRQAGYWPVIEGDTGRELRMNVSFLDDFERNVERYDMKSALARMQAAHLLIHGTEDEVIPFDETKQIVSQSDGHDLTLLAMEGSDHNLGTANRFTGGGFTLDSAIRAIVAFFGKHLDR